MELQEVSDMEVDWYQEKVLRGRLEFLLECEHIMWAQRAKNLWMIQGDRNTHFFHSVVKEKKILHHLKKIKIEKFMGSFED